MIQNLSTYLKTVGDWLKKVFVHGLFTLMPAVITVALLGFIFRCLKTWLHPIYDLEPEVLRYIPQSEIVVTAAVIVVTGVLYELFLCHLLHRLEMSVLKKIPLLSLIYFGVKRLAEALTAQGGRAVEQVVLVPFPAPGTYSIGFMTSEETPLWAPGLTGQFVGVFVPHTPNPTTGFYILVPREQCILLPISRQEAMTLVISGGLMNPQRFTVESK
jgi:uncharacterized membrane protein